MVYKQKTLLLKKLYIAIRWQVPLNCGRVCFLPGTKLAIKLLIFRVFMTNPQLENGYTPIANEILDALVGIRIPGEARQCLDFIIRKTYGYKKKEDWIALSQFVDATSLKKPTVSRALKKLLFMNMIIKKDKGLGVTYGLQKDCDKWKPLSKKITVIKKDNKGSTKKIIGGSTKKIPTIHRYYKRNITKEKEEIPFEDIIGHLNQIANRDFRPKTESYRKAIRARWNEGYRLDDFKYVNAVKAEEWLLTNMAKHLNPETLYGNKFQKYKNQEPAKNQMSELKRKNLIATQDWEPEDEIF